MLKKLIITLALLMTAAPAVANGLYFTEPMFCTGHIVNPPNYVHPDYYNVTTKFVSMFSTRRDGSLAASLEVSNEYFRTGSQPAQFNADEVWYQAPLRIAGTQVTQADLHLNLTIDTSRNENGRLVQYLKGSMSLPQGTSYSLFCKAVVVQRPSRVDNYTRH